jgi:hypothetical protein
MVIFGAGASYDSAHAYPVGQGDGLVWRPPLANDLFSNPQRAFSDIVKSYPKLTHILLYLRERSSGRSVEEELELLRDEAKEYAERSRELVSVQYYLRDLLFAVTNTWIHQTDGVTNYASLMGEILRLNREQEAVCLVTFNYDLLLDNALLSFRYQPQEPEDQFKAHPIIKLFKPHGSVDWARVLKLPRDRQLSRQEIIEKADSVEFTGQFTSIGEPIRDSHPEGKTLMPAIAIPLQNKTEDTFACPPSHLTYLRELLPSVTKILIIGWQAHEAHFLQILRSGLNKERLNHIMVVGKDSQGASSILTYFADQIGHLPPNNSVASWGFSQFVVNREGASFLQAPSKPPKEPVASK